MISIYYTQGNNLKNALNEIKYHERHLKEAHVQEMAQTLEVAEIKKKNIINDVFAFTVATDIVNDHNLSTIDECRLRHD